MLNNVLVVSIFCNDELTAFLNKKNVRLSIIVVVKSISRSNGMIWNYGIITVITAGQKNADERPVIAWNQRAFLVRRLRCDAHQAKMPHLRSHRRHAQGTA